ncbi:taurine dioxygenase [Altererythrobacter salegens]|uniref:Taurine dioxygenase n=1 Tax=Croceibacterium salegens TaxID=1737568 RepID=A0A6I4SUQ7_9SPHN|nr:TauD/TfdA family dioxygenase [Croceibacterium salegens]MXO58740.1 taurine dioxygenase [Croceibacterium salegens]
MTAITGRRIAPQAASADYRRIGVKRYSASLGAIVEGVDLSQELDDETIGEIRRALVEHLVIFFRGQDMTPDQQLAFARRFGTLNRHDQVAGMDEYPDIIEVRQEPTDTRNFGGAWHGDLTYMPEPPLGSVLYAKQVPEVGGDTLWSNLYTAYDDLSDGMKRLIDTLTVMHTPAKIYGEKALDWGKDSSVRSSPTAAAHWEHPHPLVRTHPESGRKLYYVSGAFTPRFEDMTEEESAPLLDYLMAQATREPFTCRWRWQVGDVAFWDNRATLHYALNDYAGERRVMHRVAINGEAPER